MTFVLSPRYHFQFYFSYEYKIQIFKGRSGNKTTDQFFRIIYSSANFNLKLLYKVCMCLGCKEIVCVCVCVFFFNKLIFWLRCFKTCFCILLECCDCHYFIARDRLSENMHLYTSIFYVCRSRYI